MRTGSFAAGAACILVALSALAQEETAGRALLESFPE